MLTWSDDLATGVARLDEQHQEIFRRLEAIRAAMARGDRRTASSLFGLLGSYLSDHHATEERAMAASAYPHAPRHRTAHAQLLRECAELHVELDRAGPSPALAARFEHRLVGWLADHVAHSDAMLARHLARRAGARTVPA